MVRETEKKLNSGEEAYKSIMTGIMTGELRPGVIVGELELSEKYGVGRTPVREALKRLEGEGFIVSSERKKRVYYLTTHDIEELFDLKIAIEGMVARNAALKAKDNDLNKMKEILLEMEKFERTDINGKSALLLEKDEEIVIEKWHAIDKKFHALLYDMADNHRAEIIIENINNQWHRIRIAMSAITGHLNRSVIEHQQIGIAILEREPDLAYESVKAHFGNLKRHIMQLMRSFNGC